MRGANGTARKTQATITAHRLNQLVTAVSTSHKDGGRLFGKTQADSVGKKHKQPSLFANGTSEPLLQRQVKHEQKALPSAFFSRWVSSRLMKPKWCPCTAPQGVVQGRLPLARLRPQQLCGSRGLCAARAQPTIVACAATLAQQRRAGSSAGTTDRVRAALLTPVATELTPGGAVQTSADSRKVRRPGCVPPAGQTQT